jgi:hypothetical protein
MPKQYGSNGINSDGSLMNVGNTIWDPQNGGRPSIRLYKDKNAMARTTPPWLLDAEQEPNKKINKSTNKLITKP